MDLTSDHKIRYETDGYLCNLSVFDEQSVARIRAEIEALEETHSAGTNGNVLDQYFRVNGHVVIPLLADLARTPAILNAVEDVLGENLLVWSVELFIKEAGSEKTVSWHQDITYWGMGETNDEVTAWVALSDVTEQAGCMRFCLVATKMASLRTKIPKTKTTCFRVGNKLLTSTKMTHVPVR